MRLEREKARRVWRRVWPGLAGLAPLAVAAALPG